MLDLRKAFDNERCGKKDFHAELYEKLFAPRIHDHIRMLEIGVWHGESLRVWKKFFDSLTLYGIDVNSVDDIDESIATIFIGDAAWPKFMQNVAKEGKTEKVPVKAGTVHDDTYIIESGLHAGDVVITNNLTKLRPGSAVTVAEAKE